MSVCVLLVAYTLFSLLSQMTELVAPSAPPPPPPPVESKPPRESAAPPKPGPVAEMTPSEAPQKVGEAENKAKAEPLKMGHKIARVCDWYLNFNTGVLIILFLASAICVGVKFGASCPIRPVEPCNDIDRFVYDKLVYPAVQVLHKQAEFVLYMGSRLEAARAVELLGSFVNYVAEVLVGPPPLRWEEYKPRPVRLKDFIEAMGFEPNPEFQSLTLDDTGKRTASTQHVADKVKPRGLNEEAGSVLALDRIREQARRDLDRLLQEQFDSSPTLVENLQKWATSTRAKLEEALRDSELIRPPISSADAELILKQSGAESSQIEESLRAMSELRDALHKATKSGT